MRVICTGGSGFIGSYLSQYLIHRGYDISLISRNLLYNPAHLERYLTKYNPDYIIHAAAYGNMGNQNDYEQTYHANITALFNMLSASKNIPYRKFINISSSSVYGISRNIMSEGDKLNPETPYATTKAAGELIVHGFRKFFNKNIITVRPFSVYGDGEADFRFIPIMIHSIKNNIPITLYHGNHDWIYIDDFVRALVLIMERQNYEEIYNIGTGQQTSNKIVLKSLEMIIGKKAQIEKEVSMKPEDSNVWIANINSLILLGFVPQYSLHAGLTRTVAWYGKDFEYK